MSLETQLRDELSKELDGLKDLELGKEEYKVAVDGITKLYDKLLETQKFEVETDERNRNRENDDNLKREQIADSKKDCKIRYGIDIAGIVIPVILTVWGVSKSFEFEREGTITTVIGRGFIQKLLPKLK